MNILLMEKIPHHLGFIYTSKVVHDFSPKKGSSDLLRVVVLFPFVERRIWVDSSDKI